MRTEDFGGLGNARVDEGVIKVQKARDDGLYTVTECCFGIQMEKPYYIQICIRFRNSILCSSSGEDEQSILF